MKVRDLMKALEQWPPDADVFIMLDPPDWKCPDEGAHVMTSRPDRARTDARWVARLPTKMYTPKSRESS